jgi:hypothetical protein
MTMATAGNSTDFMAFPLSRFLLPSIRLEQR